MVSFMSRPLYPWRKIRQVFIGYEAGWASEPVWTLRKREKYLDPAGNRTPAVKLIACRCND
jgi:hypothetical protein